METLNNLNWNLIGVILAGLSLLATIIIFLLQKNKKQLSYEIIANTSLLTTKEKIEGKVKILYNEIEVQNVKFFEVKLINSGNIGISATDFERSLKLQFQENSKVLSCEVIESYPRNLTTYLTIDKSEIVINPLLINSKDFFVLKIIVSNVTMDDFTIDARIKDVIEIKQLNESTQLIIWGILSSILSITGMVRLALLDKNIDKTEWNTSFFINVGLVSVGYLIMVLAMSRDKKLKKYLSFISKSNIT